MNRLPRSNLSRGLVHNDDATHPKPWCIMRIRSSKLLGTLFALSVFGCSDPDDASPPDLSVGGADAKGGSVGVTGGAPPMAGSTAQNAVTGGQKASGGSIGAAGGSKAQGGSAGGVNATGGAPRTGGRSATTSAAATGGARATGGAVSTGGSKQTGGVPASGGTTTTSKQTGGTPATGGSLATGGSPAAGGSKATGGSSTAGGATTTVTPPKKFVGNITTGNSVDPSGLKYSKYWDQITPENQGKWGSVQATPTSSFNWTTLDTIYSYTQTNNIIFKQHTFVWGAQQPNPMNSITLAQVETWIKSFCERYPKTQLIDVVNEPPPHTTPGYTAALGAGEKGSYPWITKAFKLARQYCGNAVLILNDYNTIEYTADEDRIIAIAKDIKANGAPIDAMGAQSHALKGKSATTIKANLEKLNSQTGLPIYITEFDIDDANDSSQSSAYQSFMPIFLDATYIHGITVWGWIAGRTWMTNSGIVNGTSPRPAMTWLMQKLGRPVPPN